MHVLLDLAAGRRVQQRHLEDVVLVEHLARDAQLFGHQAAGRDAAALAVAAVAHLDRRLVDVLAAHRDGAGEAGDAAAAFGLGRAGGTSRPLGRRSARDRKIASRVGFDGSQCVAIVAALNFAVFVVQVGQQVGPAAQGRHGVEPQAVEDVDQHLPPGGVQVHQPLRAPLDGDHFQQFGVGGGDAAGAAAAALAAAAADAAHGHQLGRADHHAVGPQGDGLGHVVGRADAAAGDHRDLVADALVHQELVHAVDGVLDRHGDVLLGDVRRRARAAVAAVEVHDVGARRSRRPRPPCPRRPASRPWPTAGPAG